MRPLCEGPHEVDEEATVLKVGLNVVERLAAIALDPVTEPVCESLLLHFHPLLALDRTRSILTLPTLERVKHIRPAHTHRETQLEVKDSVLTVKTTQH